MALSDITFIRKEGGLGRPLPGSDHLSGMLFFTAGSLPFGFSTNDRIKKIFSVPEAESLGIVDDHSDETKGTGGKVVIGGSWSADETATILIDGTVLATFTVVSGSTAISDIVTGLKDAINAATSTGIKHGWSAGETSGTDIDLTQPDRLGIFNNGGSHITFTETSVSGTGTPTQFTGGVGSYFAVLHYHISEYFRKQPKGVTHVGIFAQATFDGAEIETIQNFTNGQIRQLGIYVSHEAFASSQLTIIQSRLDTLSVEKAPLSVVFHSDLSGATLSALPNLTTLSDERVSKLIGEEGDYHLEAYSNTKAYLSAEKVTFQGKAYQSIAITTGNAPWDAKNWVERRENLQAISGFSIGTMGAALGCVSLASVNESIAGVAKFNLVSDTGLDEVAFATGDLAKNVTTLRKEILNDSHYIFMRKLVGSSGTFFNDSRTSISPTSDFSTIENNRTADKAKREIRTNVLPLLNSDLFVNKDGTLTEDTISIFKKDSEQALIDMVTTGELSQQKVTIDPSQLVLTTSKIEIGILLVPVGVAREIEFTISLATKIE